jgi:hypothetical protein
LCGDNNYKTIFIPAWRKKLNKVTTNLETVESAIQNKASVLIGEYGWLFLIGLVALFFKTTIESAIAGLVVFVGSDYNNDDIVIVDGQPGRIVRVTIWKTTFYLYDIREDEKGVKTIAGGTKLVVQNSQLRDMKIERPLSKMDL